MFREIRKISVVNEVGLRFTINERQDMKKPEKSRLYPVKRRRSA